MTENKVTEIFYMADDFCKFFDAMTAQYTLKPNGKRKYHQDSTMSKAEVMLIMILFHDYRCFDNFIVNSLGAIAAYCLSPKKLCINVQRTIETQLTLF